MRKFLKLCYDILFTDGDVIEDIKCDISHYSICRPDIFSHND